MDAEGNQFALRQDQHHWGVSNNLLVQHVGAVIFKFNQARGDDGGDTEAGNCHRTRRLPLLVAFVSEGGFSEVAASRHDRTRIRMWSKMK
jgi:hypothetical protein